MQTVSPAVTARPSVRCQSRERLESRFNAASPYRTTSWTSTSEEPVAPSGVNSVAEMVAPPQILLARARGALMRRPRSRGNWVQAFALHDTVGRGSLSRDAFIAFVEYLALGFSRQEVLALASSIANKGEVSLSGFSDALSTPCALDSPQDEEWARRIIQALALRTGSLTGLEAKDREEIRSLLTSHCEEEVERLLAWLPKTSDGRVDWRLTEEWSRNVVCMK